MTGLRPRKPSASMIVAIIALVVALGGTSYAAISLPANSVGAKQLKKNAVITAKIKNGAVTLAKTSGVMSANGVQAWGYSDSTSIANFTSSSFTPIASKSFTTPGSGFLLINGTLSTEADIADGGVGMLFYTLSLDGQNLASHFYAHEIDTDYANHVLGGSGAVTEVVPVSAGAHTVDLLAEEGGSGSGDYIASRQLLILFVPSGSGVAIPSVKKAAPATNPNRG